MANRVKRLERELTLVKVERQFRGRFKEEKIERKESLKSGLLLLVNATSVKDFSDHRYKNNLKSIFPLLKKLRLNHGEIFQDFSSILTCPRPLFQRPAAYERLLEVFFELEVCRSFATWQRPKSKDETVVFKSLFYHLFVKYKIPVCLNQIIEEYCFGFYDNNDARLLFHMVKGNGLHQFPYPSFKVNSKVNFHFLNAPPQLELYQTIWWATLIGKQVPYSLALKIVHQLIKLTNRLCWWDWLDDLVFFLNRFKDISQKDLKTVMDFFIAQKTEYNEIRISGLDETIDVSPLYPDFKLKGRSVASVLRFCEEWKNYINLIRAIGKGADFKPSKFQPFRIYHGKILVIIKQIKNVKSLVKEGKLMNHCVATYAGECASGETSIWTMKLHSPNQKVKKALTIEVLEEEGGINEALGKCNRSASNLEKKWLAAWAEREKLMFRI